jgi:hypothetical protein
MARPGRHTCDATLFAHSLGLTRRQLEHLGGLERVKAMPEDARALMVGMSKRESLKRLLSAEKK